MNFRVFMLLLISFLFASCASDGPEPAPRLTLDPELLITDSNVGDDISVKLNVTNQMNVQSKSSYGYDNNLKNLFLELTSDALDSRGFSVETDPYFQPDERTVLITLIINDVENHVTKTTLKSNVAAYVKVTIKVRHGKKTLQKSFESRRSQEFALSVGTDEVENIVNLAVAQILNRVVTDSEFQKTTAK